MYNNKNKTMNRELIEALTTLREELEVKKINAKKEGYYDIALAYGDAVLLVGEQIVKHLNPKTNG